MNRFRRGIQARIVASCVAASSLLVAFAPILAPRGASAPFLTQWMRSQLGFTNSGHVASALRAVDDADARSLPEFLLAFSRALIREDGELASRFTGRSDASAEELARRLHDLFGRSVRDAMLPRVFLSAATLGSAPGAERWTSMHTAAAGFCSLIVDRVFSPQKLREGFRVSLRSLTSARPLGP